MFLNLKTIPEEDSSVIKDSESPEEVKKSNRVVLDRRGITCSIEGDEDDKNQLKLYTTVVISRDDSCIFVEGSIISSSVEPQKIVTKLTIPSNVKPEDIYPNLVLRKDKDSTYTFGLKT